MAYGPGIIAKNIGYDESIVRVLCGVIVEDGYLELHNRGSGGYIINEKGRYFLTQRGGYIEQINQRLEEKYLEYQEVLKDREIQQKAVEISEKALKVSERTSNDNISSNRYSRKLAIWVPIITSTLTFLGSWIIVKYSEPIQIETINENVDSLKKTNVYLQSQIDSLKTLRFNRSSKVIPVLNSNDTELQDDTQIVTDSVRIRGEDNNRK